MLTPHPDHPRSRGEYRSAPSTPKTHVGSSPLSRGIRKQAWQNRCQTGIIPALAGNTNSCGGSIMRWTDHPRSRGEYYVKTLFGRVRYGSSPLSRGIRTGPAPRSPPAGIIPALAGNTPSHRPANPSSPDHPRSRGEYEDWCRGEDHHNGSSPLSRGIRLIGPSNQIHIRIIPALAGNTYNTLAGTVDDAWIIPALAGNTSQRFGGLVVWSGSSPLSRGIRCCVWKSLHWSRIIPALAGNTLDSGTNTGKHRDHPRSRGEYEFGDSGLEAVSGSSPLSRGIQWRAP